MDKIEKSKADISKRLFKVGDIFLDKDGSIFVIKKLTQKGAEFYCVNNDGSLGHLYGCIDYNRLSFREQNDKSNCYIKIDTPIAELERDVFDNINAFVASEYKKIDGETDTESNSTSLVSSGGSKELLLSMKTSIEKTACKIEIMQRLMERKKNELENIHRHYTEKLKKIQKVLGVFELYLGIGEEIIQIQDGEEAQKDELIYFRQLVLYMDEEVAITKDEGLDYKNFDIFDQWLLTDKNYLKMVPEQKCVVAFRPRRFDKESDSGYSGYKYRREAQGEDHKTYFLIRNGEKLYRIVSSFEVFNSNMFPTVQEMNKLIDRSNDDAEFFSDKEKAQNTIFNYKKQIVFMQGLVDRTPIFGAYTGINFFKPETYKNVVAFIYDGSMTLPNGRLLWNDWVNLHNKNIRLGTRIVFKGFGFLKPDDIYYYFRRKWIPGFGGPRPGIYNINRIEFEYRKDDGKTNSFFEIRTRKDEQNTKNIKRDNESLVCHYNPEDEISKFSRETWKRIYYARRKSIAFFLCRSSFYILNYDEASSEDFEYYLNNRIDRQNYLDMIPILKNLKEMKLEEELWEKNFIEFLDNDIRKHLTITTDIDLKTMIQEGIEWWKFKVIWTRPLKKEDAKALRMIKGYVLRKIGGKNASTI